MCRSIQPLFNVEPRAQRVDVEAAARQFVRKVSGFRVPSVANERAFERSVRRIAREVEDLLASLVAGAPARVRHVHEGTSMPKVSTRSSHRAMRRSV